MVFGSVPFFSRQVESALAELDHGLVEAALSMGSGPLEIIFRVYLRESVADVIELKLTPEEQAQFAASCETMDQNCKLSLTL